MVVPSSHVRGLSPDTSAEDVSRRGRSHPSSLLAGRVRVPSGHGRGLSPDTSAEDV
jgi:hypothetical protein